MASAHPRRSGVRASRGVNTGCCPARAPPGSREDGANLAEAREHDAVRGNAGGDFGQREVGDAGGRGGEACRILRDAAAAHVEAGNVEPRGLCGPAVQGEVELARRGEDEPCPRHGKCARQIELAGMCKVTPGVAE